MSDIDDNPDNQFWYNSRTGEVEQGPQSHGADRVGPFATREEAAAAPELLAERSQAWAADDADDDAWGSGTP